TTGSKDKFTASGKKIFFKKGEKAYLPGEFLKQPQLAKALRALRDQGPKGFYSGAVAKDLVQSVKNSGGVLSLEDLKSYTTRWLQPLQTSYKGHQIYMMPPPSSAGVVMAQ